MAERLLVQDIESNAYFASDELCVVASTHAPNAPPDYAAVMEIVNSEITRRLAQEGAAARFPALLRNVRGRGVLVRLARETLPDAAMKDPMVAFQRKQGANTRLHFFSVELPGLEARLEGAAQIPEKTGAIRDLVELLSDPPFADDSSDYVATPNWLSAAGDGPGVGGGPGTEPELPGDSGIDPRADQRFHFGTGLEKLVMAEREKAADAARREVPVDAQLRDANVVVAILDTCPKPDAAGQAAARIAADGYKNELLNEMVGTTAAGAVPPVTIEGAISVDPAYFARIVATYAPDWPGRMAVTGAGGGSPGRYDIVDHGLFAAGIVKDICPTADIRLIRVLDSCGVGDLFALAQTLVALAHQFREEFGGEKRLVVNLSLMLAIPPAAELDLLWPTRPKNVDQGLAEVIAWLEEQDEGNILVVAAAGNDGLRFLAPPEPRCPARFESVISVAALDADGHPSNFTNEGDDSPATPNGVATLGGRALIREKAGHGHTASRGSRTVRYLGSDDVEGIKIATHSGRPDAVLGIFSTENSAFTGNPNKTGWGWWGGTSFATPIISGIAAVLWQGDPNLSAHALTHKIVRGPYRGTWKRALNCYTIDAHQEGRAYWYA